MITIPSIRIDKGSQTFIVYPRVEVMTDCMSKKDCIFELLCQAQELTGSKYVHPEVFFDNLDNADIYRLYSHCLTSLADQGVFSISLNVSTDFIRSTEIERLIQDFQQIKLIFEYSENGSLHSSDFIDVRLTSLKHNANVSFWLDDFGSKLANFDLVAKLPFDGVKISKELFWDLYFTDKMFLKHLIRVLRLSLRMVVIEGVDCFDKYVFCKDNKCFMQGYFFLEQEKVERLKTAKK